MFSRSSLNTYNLNVFAHIYIYIYIYIYNKIEQNFLGFCTAKKYIADFDVHGTVHR